MIWECRTTLQKRKEKVREETREYEEKIVESLERRRSEGEEGGVRGGKVQMEE